jgi:hypothetical protein
MFQHAAVRPDRRPIRLAIWLAITALVTVGLLGVSARNNPVLASTSLHQTPPIAWNATGFEGDDCAALGLDPGEVAWHFVLVQTSAGVAGSTLTATFTDATQNQTVNATKKTGGTLHFFVFTNQTTLLSAITNRDGFRLNLSHICAGTETTTETITTTVSGT